MTLQTWSVRRVTQAHQLQQPLRILLMLASGLDPAPPDARNGDKTRGGQNRLDIMAKGDKFVHRLQRLNRPGEERKSAAKQDQLMSSHRARSFTRAVQLHNAADEDKMTSADTNRVLTITLMK